jgi:hypothetical protein
VYLSVLRFMLSINGMPEIRFLEILILFSQTSLVVFNFLQLAQRFLFLFLNTSDYAS